MTALPALPSAPGLPGVALAGVAAGLAVAVPMGPIGLLLLDAAAGRGRRTGLAAAAGVAAVDGAYAAVAVIATTAVAAAVTPVRAPAALVGAGVLGVLGLRGLVRAGDAPPPGRGVDRGSARRTFAAFVALTAVNPATLLAFSALAVGLGDRLAGAAERAVFVGAVTASSLAWQSGLALAGGLLGRAAHPRLRQATRRIGGLALLGFALLLVAQAR